MVWVVGTSAPGPIFAGRVSAATDPPAGAYTPLQPFRILDTRSPSPSAWSIMPSPDSSPTEQNVLNGVSCVSATDCWAVGYHWDPAINGYDALVEHDAGAGWMIAPAAKLPEWGVPSSGFLTSVACVSATDCWAVGYQGWWEGTYFGEEQTLIEQYTGSSWVVDQIGIPGFEGPLFGVTCLSADDCWAVGAETLHYTSAGWSLVDVAQRFYPGEEAMELAGVTCVGAEDCWAVGNWYEDSTGEPSFPGYNTLALHWDGSGWSVTASASPGDDGWDYLTGVTCADSDDCWASGYSGFQPLIEQWDPTADAWVSASSPGMPITTGSDPSGELNGIACPTSNSCWAVGNYESDDSNLDQSLVEQETAGGWVSAATPIIEYEEVTLTGISCVSADSCWAVGYTGDGAYQGEGGGQTVIEQLGRETLGPGQFLTLQVTGVSGPENQSVPSTAQAAVLNVTAISGTAGTFLTVFPAATGFAVPTASNINVNAQTNEANLVVVAIGTDGQVSIFNSQGWIDAAVDVEGYFAAPSVTTAVPGLFHPMAPLRICDTRQGTGTVCSGTTSDNPLGPGRWTKVVISGCPTGNPSCSASVPADGTAAAAALNLTAVSGTSFTYLSVAPPSGSNTCPSGAPTFSNLNVNAQTNLPNRVIVPLGPDRDVCVYNSLGSINFILDLNGWFGTGSEVSQGAYYYAITPTRICDTRSAASVGYGTECTGETLGPGESLTVQVAGVDGIPAAGGSTPPVAVIANVTAASGTSFTYFTLYPADSTSVPNASDLNVDAYQNTPNLSIVQLASTGVSAGAIDLYNNLGNIDAIVDVAGWFE
jgi:hypothetical protein